MCGIAVLLVVGMLLFLTAGDDGSTPTTTPTPTDSTPAPIDPLAPTEPPDVTGRRTAPGVVFRWTSPDGAQTGDSWQWRRTDTGEEQRTTETSVTVERRRAGMPPGPPDPRQLRLTLGEPMRRLRLLPSSRAPALAPLGPPAADASPRLAHPRAARPHRAEWQPHRNDRARPRGSVRSGVTDARRRLGDVRRQVRDRLRAAASSSSRPVSVTSAWVRRPSAGCGKALDVPRAASRSTTPTTRPGDAGRWAELDRAERAVDEVAQGLQLGGADAGPPRDGWLNGRGGLDQLVERRERGHPVEPTEPRGLTENADSAWRQQEQHAQRPGQVGDDRAEDAAGHPALQPDDQAERGRAASTSSGMPLAAVTSGVDDGGDQDGVPAADAGVERPTEVELLGDRR